jgi:YebC/PmpR family DNA-binding regulatory protein
LFIGTVRSFLNPMAGHSKWSKVKHQKAVTDVVKAKAFTRASRAITIAVKEGGSITDPVSNFKLRLAIEKAKEVNMPKDNIDRAIAKGKGEGGAQIESLVYEAYGPQGVAFIIESATENKQRTVSLIKNVFDHHEGSLATPGSVAYQFNKIGMIVLRRPIPTTDDELFTTVIDAGASDISFFDDAVEITTEVSLLEVVRQHLADKAFSIESAEIVYISTLPITIPEEVQQKIDTITDLLNELDDVQRVYTNIN